MLDYVIRNARVAGAANGGNVDIGFSKGKIAAIEPGLVADSPSYDAQGCLCCGGLVETHIRPIYEFVRTMLVAAEREGLVPLGRPEHLHYMLIGAASSVYALAAEFELLTGEHPSDDALVAEHVAALERLFFPAAPARAARAT